MTTTHPLIPDRATLEQYLGQLQGIAAWLQSIEAAQDFCENCRLSGETSTAEYQQAMQFLIGAEHLGIAIAYWQSLLDRSQPTTQG